MTAPADPTRAAHPGALTPDAAGAAPTDGTDLLALEGLARVLTSSGHYRVLRQFRPRQRYHVPCDRPLHTALFVDVEATGLDTARDAIIEFAAVPFTYCPERGEIHEVLAPYVALEDPGRDIPSEVQALTGITADMVAGRRIDDLAVARLVHDVRLVIAHNAGYDRPMVERRFPLFAKKPWACSLSDVDWKHFGIRGSKLDYLLFQRCAEFFEGHRAEHDCQAAIHVLATACDKGHPFRMLLESARRPTYRVRALQAPFEVKDVLKARGYRWHGEARYWYRDCAPDLLDAELAWLCAECYENRLGPDDLRTHHVEHFDARKRYSARVS